MKQILQNLKTGRTEILECPYPAVKRGHLLIRTSASLISAGTERMLVEFGNANLLEKARQQPDKVRQVIDKLKTDGIWPTLEAVRSKLDQPLPLGYSNTGVVVEVGQDVGDFTVGDRVASNGPHAEVVSVPKNLCAKIPESVKNEEAAFTALSAIALQGIRLLMPTLGESVAVIGLGLIGLITVQLLKAHGCHVLGIDLDTAKCDLARLFGAKIADISKGEDPLTASEHFSRSRGVDGVLITAATKSNEPVHQAAQMCRPRGRIVLVGVTGLELQRSDFYEKELSFQVSCSYGPGRYNPEYEEKGHDYPLGYVRWTEQRNFEAVLDMMAAGKLVVKPLVSHRFPFEEAEKAYTFITDNTEPFVGIVLKYQQDKKEVRNKTVILAAEETSRYTNDTASAPSDCIIGLIGAGNYTGQVLLPALLKTSARLKTIASTSGLNVTHLGKKFGFVKSTTEVDSIFSDSEINTVFITTRHDSHAHLVIQALNAGKNVFVEKPLCLNQQQLDAVIEVVEELSRTKAHNTVSHPSALSFPPLLMVGFNRRFAPQIRKMKELLDSVILPKKFVMTVNAGMISAHHWTQDPEVGGGRIIGEAVHFVDLLRYLAGVPIKRSEIFELESPTRDTASIQLSFADGSLGTIHYFANGNKGFPKERLEVFTAGKIFQLGNFDMLRGYGWKGFKKMRLWRQDKGHAAEVDEFVRAVVEGLPSPIPFDEITEVSKVTLQLSRR